MSWIDDYIKSFSGQGKSIGESLAIKTKKFHDLKLKDSHMYQQIFLDEIPINARVVEYKGGGNFSSRIFDNKQLLFHSDQEFSIGQIATINNEKYIIFDKNQTDVFPKAAIIKCNTVLKWLDSVGNIVSIPAHFTTSSSTLNADVEYDTKMVLPSSMRTAIIKDDQYAKLIKRGRRFIVGRDAWEVVGIDDVTKKGLCYLTLEFSQTSSNDNLELGIADYFNNLPKYLIEILNGESSNVDLNGTLPLNYVIKLNGDTVSLPVQFTSSDTNIATVDSNGLIQGVNIGVCTITVSLVDRPDVKDTISIEVKPLIVLDNYSVVIDGVDSIRKSQSATYTAKILNNGIEDASKTVIWSIRNEDNSPTPYATITSQNGTTCTVLAGATYGKYIILKAAYDLDSSVYVEKRILIKSVF